MKVRLGGGVGGGGGILFFDVRGHGLSGITASANGLGGISIFGLPQRGVFTGGILENDMTIGNP